MIRYPGKFNMAIFLSVLLIFLSCAEEPEYDNPLDARNPRTAGSPRGLTLVPGDAKVEIRFLGTGFESGIKEYIIYRMFTGDAVPEFEEVGRVEFKKDPATDREQQQYVFIDEKDLKNDQVDDAGEPYYYVYRIAYEDINGLETPNPDSPPSQDGEPLRIWREVRVTPSVPPEPPEVTVGSQIDLTLTLSWESYQSPDDIAGYRIYQVRTTESGRELVLLAENKPDIKNYIDRNFHSDNATKKYRVVAYDKFGVESRSGDIVGTSPNLPPSSGPETEIQYDFGMFFEMTSYDVNIKWEWKRGKEPPDLGGYSIYSTQLDPVSGEWKWQRRSDHNKTTKNYTFQNEPYYLIDGFMPAVTYYHVVAYDNTLKEDKTKDESPLPPVPEPPYRPVF